MSSESAAAPTFIEILKQAGLLPPERIASLEAAAAAGHPPAEAAVRSGALPQAVVDALVQSLDAPQRIPPLRIGRFLALRKLGEGGMGAVYRGIQLDDSADGRTAGQPVAIKLLKKEAVTDQHEFAERFLREARSALTLRHPNITGGLEAGEYEGNPFYVMEYFKGESLDLLLKREKHVATARALEIVIQAARGLEFAHKLGFVHRDIKPGNLYLTAEGATKLLDFGLVKNTNPGQEALTAPGTMVGSPNYISPEQVRGNMVVDGRADIYSLGCTFYHLVTGRQPFGGATTATVILKHLNDPPPDPRVLAPDLSTGLVQVLFKMLSKDRDQRYRDCTSLLADLTAIKEGRAPTLIHDELTQTEIQTVITPVDAIFGRNFTPQPGEALPPAPHQPPPQPPAPQKPPDSGKPWWKFWGK